MECGQLKLSPPPQLYPLLCKTFLFHLVTFFYHKIQFSPVSLFFLQMFGNLVPFGGRLYQAEGPYHHPPHMDRGLYPGTPLGFIFRARNPRPGTSRASILRGKMAPWNGRRSLLPHREHGAVLRPAPSCDILLLPPHLGEGNLSKRPHRFGRHPPEISSKSQNRSVEDVGCCRPGFPP